MEIGGTIRRQRMVWSGGSAVWCPALACLTPGALWAALIAHIALSAPCVAVLTFVKRKALNGCLVADLALSGGLCVVVYSECDRL